MNVDVIALRLHHPSSGGRDIALEGDNWGTFTEHAKVEDQQSAVAEVPKSALVWSRWIS